KAASVVLGALTSERQSNLAQFSYDQMWENLYFNELKDVLDRQWDAFQSWFAEDKSNVLEWMDHVNKSRVDAHARSLSEEDLAYLRVCFRRLEQKVFV